MYVRLYWHGVILYGLICPVIIVVVVTIVAGDLRRVTHQCMTLTLPQRVRMDGRELQPVCLLPPSFLALHIHTLLSQ